jgi:hypothetical protein
MTRDAVSRSALVSPHRTRDRRMPQAGPLARSLAAAIAGATGRLHDRHVSPVLPAPRPANEERQEDNMGGASLRRMPLSDRRRSA